MEDMITLTTSDGIEFTVLACLKEQSTTIADLSKEVGEGQPIPLEDIDSETTKHVVAYMMYAKDVKPEPVVEEDPALKLDDPNHVLDTPYELTEFEKDYIKDMDHATLVKLMHASSYLHVEKLVKVSMRAIAIMYLGAPVADIYKYWGVDISKPFDPNDPNVGEITKEEEEAIIKENPWLADK